MKVFIYRLSGDIASSDQTTYVIVAESQIRADSLVRDTECDEDFERFECTELDATKETVWYTHG